MRRGGHKVYLDGYEENAARHGGQVAANARMSRRELNRGKIECSSSCGRSFQPWSPHTTRCVEAEATNQLFGVCMMANYLLTHSEFKANRLERAKKNIYIENIYIIDV
jgi:hypothetical protein